MHFIFIITEYSRNGQCIIYYYYSLKKKKVSVLRTCVSCFCKKRPKNNEEDNNVSEDNIEQFKKKTWKT